jgi:hypothetical protein
MVDFRWLLPAHDGLRPPPRRWLQFTANGRASNTAEAHGACPGGPPSILSKDRYGAARFESGRRCGLDRRSALAAERLRDQTKASRFTRRPVRCRDLAADYRRPVVDVYLALSSEPVGFPTNGRSACRSSKRPATMSLRQPRGRHDCEPTSTLGANDVPILPTGVPVGDTEAHAIKAFTRSPHAALSGLARTRRRSAS